MEDFLGLLFLALFFIVPKLLRQKNKKPQPPQSPTHPEVSLPPPFSKKEMPVVNDIFFEPLEKVERRRAPIQKKPVYKRKFRKNNLHTLLKELPSKKEIFILSEILKRPSL